MKFKRIVSLFFAFIMLMGVLSMTSCGAPKLDEVKGEFERLIKESYAINEILFGDGLSGYGNLDYDEATGIYDTLYYTTADGRLCAYRDTKKGEYVVLRVADADGEGCVFKNEEKGRYYFPTELTYDEGDRTLPETPYGYRHVRTDERCTTVNEITALASTVYSEDYLADLFTILFDIGSAEETGMTYSAKYIEMVDEESGKTYLLCADAKTSPPIDDGERIYDYESMVIGKRSRRNYVNLEIRAYGRYADTERGEVVTGWHTVTLSFVKQGGEWRLDAPTY